MPFQAAPAGNANIQNQNFAQPISTKGLTPPIFIRTFQAAPLPANVNSPTVGYPIG